MTTDGDGNNPFAGGLDLGALMGQVRNMQTRMQEAQEAAAKVRVTGNAGGGMVVATADGSGKVVRVEIEDALFETGDKSMIEDLVVAAVNQAVDRGKEAMQQEMSKVTGGIPMPFDISKMF